MNRFCTAWRFLGVLCAITLLLLCVSGTANAQTCTFTKATGQATVYTVQGVTGDDLSLTLESNPSTGFGWQVESMPAGLQLRERDLTSPQPSKNGGAVNGAPRQEHFVFRALASGQGTVVLSYRRSWEQDVPPARYAICLVDVR